MNDKIIDFIQQKEEATPKEISEYLGLSRQMTHRYLKALLHQNKIFKIGSAPNVYYKAVEIKSKNYGLLDEEDSFYLQNNFIEITNSGQLLKGEEAFLYWCEKRDLPLKKTYDEYRKTLLKYDKFKNNGIISGKDKLENTKGFSHIYLEDVFYLDFYAIERFGKTLLGKLIHFGKQSQNKKLLDEIVKITKQDILNLINKLGVDAIAYIPPTINRQIQIMTVLENGYAISLPKIKLVKVKGEIVIPQKALSKIKDRIENTQQSIMVADKRTFNSVLLIDDAVGSGATLNETAGKLVKKSLASKVFGLAITGSYKGFEVITEA